MEYSRAMAASQPVAPHQGLEKVCETKHARAWTPEEAAVRMPCFGEGSAWQECASHQVVPLSQRALRCRANV